MIPSPHQRGHRGSLDPGFPPAFLLVRNTVRLAFALALRSAFLTQMSQPLGPADIFSAGSRPRQTTHLSVSSIS